MIFFSKTISTSLNSIGQRLIKVLRMGLGDVQEPKQSAPFGIDSNPIEGMVAVYARTSANGEATIIGYVQRDCLADAGETRLFSTNSSGTLQTYVWLTNDGFIELGGDSGNAVRFQELKTGFDQLKTDFNNFVTAYNTHIHPASSGTTSPTASTATASTADISTAKINEIKTP